MENVWRVNGEGGEPLPDTELSIEGCLFGYYAQGTAGELQPVLLDVAGNRVLALFSSIEKLRACYAAVGLPDSLAVKEVTGGAEFLAALPAALPVVLDPFVTERGTTRFTLVKSGAEAHS